MKYFLHINSTNCNWKVDDLISFDDDDNYYWKSFKEKDESFNLKGQKHEAYKVINAAFEAYAKIHPPPLVMKEYHFSYLDTLKESLECLRNSIMINRELIFENVRRELFPNHPSRHKCIWLIRDDQESLNFWQQILNSKNTELKLFRIKILDGSIHMASQKWLEGGTISINQWRQMAENYWNGKNSGNLEDEILYQGKIKIIEEKTLPNIC